MQGSFTFVQKVQLFIAELLGPLLINLLGATWKVQISGESKIHPQRHQTEKRIYCFWHNKLLGLCFTQQKKNVGILISSHFDGEIIARITKRLGYHPHRGSSTRGGAAGLMAMLKDDHVWYLAITVDGPRGPKEVVKPGVIYLALKSGLPIVPVSCNSSDKWVLKSWDNFEIPKPFARITVAMGQPIYIDSSKTDKQIKSSTDTIAEAIKELEQCT